MSPYLLILVLASIPALHIGSHVLSVTLNGVSLDAYYNGTYQDYLVRTETVNLSSCRLVIVWVVLYNGSSPHSQPGIYPGGVYLNVGGQQITVPLFAIQPNSSRFYSLQSYGVGLFVFANLTNVSSPATRLPAYRSHAGSFLPLYGVLGALIFTAFQVLRRNK
ncbi:hypothetical protein [Sulfodiicoccus acidiphilus]|uniref:hypothetical protein n=1 Tax=Sulfodiicoccus acidiphilus TaxID=1670455 RepID=UPI0011AEC322|nr:hypothetical protein [Sulfodiicoccus acidiphilus]